MAKQAFDAPRLGGFFSYDPADLMLIVDPTDRLYDYHVEDEVSDADVLNAAALGIQQNITIRQRGEKIIVVAGRQRTKRALIVNALLGVPYKGPVKSVHAAIKRMSTEKDSIEVARRVVALMARVKGKPMRLAANGRNGNDDGEARIIGFSENAFRRNEDPVTLRALEAKQLENIGWDVTRIAEELGGISVATVNRYLKLDLTKPRTKEKRPKLVRPSAVAITKVHEKIAGKLSERERVLLDWVRHGKGDAKAILAAFGVKE